MDAALLNPSKYIKAAQFNGRDVTLTIRQVKMEDLVREDNSTEKRGCVFFNETDKGWVLNVTNVKALVKMWGNETDNWVGHKVTLYPEPSDMSESGFAIRVRGSPELQKDITFTLKLARKKPRQVTLRVTGKKVGANGNGHGKSPPAAAQGRIEEPPEDFTGGEDLFKDREPLPEQEQEQQQRP